ncbi:putative secreted protein (Por secretion system target) [Taibaiella chishuiensis]|uniref:Putative secreted protein (Por secretion system target) n=2 Tax=Taibaiella chishuiensis TaxID=1434707 RepID=A0A2P8DBD5_9BACT|nr:putative secreted protein (Por secretion system target) [Taibaiella chishuiensis]
MFTRRLKGVATALVLSLLFLCEGKLAYAQIPASSYSYAPASGTFTEITGGTNVTDIESDEDYSGALPIGFTFNYCGVDYTDVVASSNGWLSFGSPTTSASYNDIGTLPDIKPVLLPLWADLAGDMGEARYEVSGTAPNRVFTFQFKNWLWNYNASGAVISFQVKLYETTNVIEYIYRPESSSIYGFSTAVIGIVDDAGTPNYLSLNNSSATATASSTTYTNSIATKPANGQIYRFTPPPNCAGATFPAPAAASVFPASVCVTGNVTLSITTAMPIVTNLKYQWQSSPTGAAPWTSLSAPVNQSTYSAAVSTPMYFRCRAICNGDTVAPAWTSTATPQVTVDNPGSATASNVSRCGPGTLVLTANGTASGPVLKWYTEPTGGAPIGTGSPFTTPYVPSTDTFYVTAGTTVVPGSQTLGAGALTTLYNEVTPFYGSYGGYKHQFLIRASELIALGIAPGSTLTSIAFDVTTTTGNTFDSFAVSLKNTTTNAYDDYPTALETGAVQVKTPANHTTSAGINTFAFTTPFVWDGNNLIVQTCWSNATTSNPTSEIKFDNLTFNATQYGMQDNAAAATVCDNPSVIGYSSLKRRPKIVFGYEASCQGPRIPVIATITPSPALVTTAPDVVCNNAVGNITVTPSGTPYTTYSWTPAADLYTNATGTTAYVAGSSATQLYFKATGAGEHVHYLFASNTTTGCNFADTVRIWNQPGNVTIHAIPDTICNGGTSQMSLVPATNYYPGSIQWDESADGVTFTPIPGATGTGYTTPVITTNHFYRARIKAGTTDCQVPEQLIVVSHPALVSTKDSFNCGVGTVVLEAETGGFSVARWYTSPTAIFPIGSGSPFTTPYLGATTTYYVAASSGTPQPGPTMIGSGTNYSDYTDVPYNLVYSGSKVQYLLTGSSLQAAGFSAGYITALGFDVITAGDEVENMSISMKPTSLTTLTAPNLETGLQTVFTAATYQPVSNTVNVHTFQTPFYWDGSTNIVVEECHNNEYSGTSSEVKVIYNGSGLTNTKDEADHCTMPTATTYSTYGTQPNIQITMQGPCESARQPVVATIHPKPVVNLGQDINKCVDLGQEATVLDAGVQPNSPQFLWDDNTTSQVRAVTQSGTYSVRVTNSFTCVGGDTINVTLRKNPVVNLGADTSVCNGATLTLNAGNDGVAYFWNTGENTNTIDVNTPGTYIAFVTNAEACMKSDSITVNMQGELPTIQGISVTNNGGYSFFYTAVNPMNVIGYDWDFGDGSPHVYTPTANHTYAAAGNYMVILKLSSSCGFYSDSSSANIVGIRQVVVGNDVLSVYPNPATGSATILNKGDLKMEQVLVYNVLGQVVYRAKADGNDKHTLSLSGIAAGVYTIQVQTDKGMVARKLEILR